MWHMTAIKFLRVINNKEKNIFFCWKTSKRWNQHVSMCDDCVEILIQEFFWTEFILRFDFNENIHNSFQQIQMKCVFDLVSNPSMMKYLNFEWFPFSVCSALIILFWLDEMKERHKMILFFFCILQLSSRRLIWKLEKETNI